MPSKVENTTQQTMPRRLRRIFCLDDFEPAAKAHLPRPLFGYIAGAAETNASLDGNRRAFAKYRFVPRVMVNIADRNTATNLFSQQFSAPVGIAPLGLSALTAYRGDLALAKAAASARIPMIMSGSSLIRLEEVAAVYPQAWFQAYLPGEPVAIAALVERVKRAGFQTLVITVDTPVAANRENNLRAGFSTPLRPRFRLAWEGLSHPRWLAGTFAATILRHGMPHFENNYATRGAPILSPTVERDFSDRGHLDWWHLSAIREQWGGVLIIKGILSAADARRARECGADGIIVSNHGGRQLDGAVSPLTVLPSIVEACPDLPVMIDGGIRRGSDVIKALALGAQAAFVGRPFAYAASTDGEEGVGHAIRLVTSEISRNMAMLGVNRLDQLDSRMHLMAE
ncbi:alpha-hydroxy acid oxidase [Burkholderia cepacia]|uniref:alpha-hydroxy acid oxidase n=1 Tax=Burkholderia cepacia TaxID=292 RepID=UPI001F3C2B08|nr:alpha-hydroxy acid oxidase [Burkholderia cepacia]MCE4124373.1 alpha-hydroxy-acid oxidizing protein [Burkholderia cepacia]